MIEIKELEARTHHLLKTIGYNSDIVSEKFKFFISVCNSISIVLLHFSLDRYALKILQKALKIDIKMYFEGDYEDRCWTGRLLIYCNLAYLLLKSKDSRSCLKFLYDTETLVHEIKETGKNINDIKLGHSLLTFLALIQIKKIENAEKYLSVAIESFSLVSKRFNETSCKVIFCLLEFLRIVIVEYSSDNYISVQNAFHQIINYEEESSAARSLLEKFQKFKVHRGIDLIQHQSFYEIVFISVFFPFISKKTPEISVDELTRLENQQKKLTKSEISHIVSNGRKSPQDNYSLLMKKSIEEAKFK